MSRYRALRSLGCDPLSAGFIAALNRAFGVPSHLIVFMTVVIEIEQENPHG